MSTESENHFAFSQTEQDCKKELRDMETSYYNYLVDPLITLEVIHPSAHTRVMFNRELGKIQRLINGETNNTTFIADMITENKRDEKPKLGIRALPAFFRNGDRVSHIYDLLLSNGEFKAWKQKDFDILMGIEIAQGRAIKRYEGVLEEKIAALQREKEELPELDIISDDNNEGDVRIPVNRKRRQDLIQDFLKLVQENILSKEDALYWLRADFQGFRHVQKERVLSPKTKKGYIKYFIREICYKYYEEDTRQFLMYRNMLRKRISLCAKSSDKELRAHFSAKPLTYPLGLEIA